MVVAFPDPTKGSSLEGTRQIWDTNYVGRRDAFTIFREVICNNFQPWSPEKVGDEVFEARVEALTYDEGVLGRIRTSPIIAFKTKLNIASSDHECVHGNYILSGKLLLKQGIHTNVAQRGDLILYLNSELTKLTVAGDVAFDTIRFAVPTSGLLIDNSYLFRNLLLKKGKMLRALEYCLSLLNENFYAADPAQLLGIFRAIIALLPLAARQPNRDDPKEVLQLSLQQEILNFVRCNLADQHLSPGVVAEQFGISTRYLHKLFTYVEPRTTTFGSFLTKERLTRIQCELASKDMKHVPVSGFAYRWGFSELSTFNRAFRTHFGCTPTEFRQRLATIKLFP